MHIRYNETLLKYEYTTTDIDTGPWLTLPLANNVGGALANVAYTNVGNTFTTSQTITNSSGDLPRLTFNNVSGGVNLKNWQILNYNDQLQFWALNDAQDTVLGSIAMNRSGALFTGGFISSTGVMYPGRIDNGAQQTAWYLASHGSYGLYTATGLHVAGNIWSAGQILSRGQFAIGEWIDIVLAQANFWSDGSGVTFQGVEAKYMIIGHTAWVDYRVYLAVNAANVTFIYCHLPVVSHRISSGHGFFAGPIIGSMHTASEAGTQTWLWQRSSRHPYDNQLWQAGSYVFYAHICIQMRD